MILRKIGSLTLLIQLIGRVLRILKPEHEETFIFASGYAEDAFEKNLPESEHGKFGFIPKPYSLKQLATAVKETLDEED